MSGSRLELFPSLGWLQKLDSWCARQLLDEDTVRERLGPALAAGQDVPTVAAWLDGFLGEDLRGLERDTASAAVNEELGVLAVAIGLRMLGVGE